MQITVFGASGKVGRLVVSEALAQGYEVVAFVHRSHDFPAHPNLRIAQGDIHNPEDVAAALKGSKAVISALGSWGTKQKDIVSAGMANIIPAMQAQGIRRIISLTGADARAAGDSLSLIHRLSHAAIRLTPAAKILKDGERHITLLEQSGLDWTVVRSPVMTGRGSEQFALSSTRPAPWATVNRQAVALCMVGLLEDARQAGQALFIVRA